MTPNGNHVRICASDEKFLLSKISNITSICDSTKNMMVSIYLINEGYFIYCNGAIKKIVGDKCDKLLNGGWNYWFSLIDEKESLQIKKKILTLFSNLSVQGQFILRYPITNVHGEWVYIRHEILLYKLRRYTLAINYFSDVTVKEKIERYFKVSNGDRGFNSSYQQIKSISPREKEVLKLVADGFSSKQIADRLYISNHTAISHRKNLKEKFNVKNTAQLIKRASRNIELW